MPEDPADPAALILGLRRAGWRDVQIARQIGVQPSTVCRLGQGAIRFPRHQTVARLQELAARPPAGGHGPGVPGPRR